MGWLTGSLLAPKPLSHFTRHRILLRHVPAGGLHNKLELVRSKKRVVTELEAEAGELLQLLEQILLMLEDVHRYLGMQLHDQVVALAFDPHAAHRTLHPTHNGFGRENASGAMTSGARLGHVLQMALPHPLTRHFHEPEIAHGERLRPSAVATEVRSELLQHLVAIRLRLHVDEVANDDPADVAEPQLARQLRLRDIGGIIVCDFIDMETKANRDKVLQELRANLSRDRARTKAFAVSELGLIEMTRQRVRASHYQNMTEFCTVCAGTGRVFTPESTMRRFERSVRRMASDGMKDSLIVKVHPEVALYVLEHEHDMIHKLEKSVGFSLDVRDDPLLKPDEFKLVVKSAGRDVTQQYAVA